MTEVSSAVQIDAPAEKVWAVLSDLSAVQEYSPAVAEAKYTSEARTGIGASRHSDLVNPSGWLEERVDDWDEGRSMTIEIYDNGGPLKRALGRFDLTSNGQGTIVSLTLSYELRLGPLGMLMDMLFARPQIAEAVWSTTRGLKHRVETGQAVTDQILVELQAAA